ncbi:hypothetical protein D3C72_2092790 [compost metagenome]
MKVRSPFTVMVPMGDGGATMTEFTFGIIIMLFIGAAALGDSVAPDSSVVSPTVPEPARVPLTVK